MSKRIVNLARVRDKLKSTSVSVTKLLHSSKGIWECVQPFRSINSNSLLTYFGILYAFWGLVYFSIVVVF